MKGQLQTQTLADNTLYNRQLAIVLMLVGFFIKLSTLPSLLYQRVGTATLFVIIALCLYEITSFALTYLFIYRGGIETMEKGGSKVYKVVLFIWMLSLIAKQVFIYSLSSSYVTTELFQIDNASIIILTLLVPIVYLAYKGIVTIARTTEIVAIFVIFLILFDLIFLRTDLNLSENMPFFGDNLGSTLKNLPRYGVWAGDTLPFLLIKVKNKRFPYIKLGVGMTFTSIIVVGLIAVSMFGPYLIEAGNTLVAFTPFNDLTSSLGRLEWTALITYTTMVIITLGLNCWTVSELFRLLFKKKFVGIIVNIIPILAVLLFVAEADKIEQASSGIIGYIIFGIQAVVPVALLIIQRLHLKRTRKAIAPDSSKLLLASNGGVQ